MAAPDWVVARQGHDGRCDHYDEFDNAGFGYWEAEWGNSWVTVECRKPATHRGWFVEPWTGERERVRLCAEHARMAHAPHSPFFRFRKV